MPALEVIIATHEPFGRQIVFQTRFVVFGRVEYRLCTFFAHGLNARMAVHVQQLGFDSPSLDVFLLSMICAVLVLKYCIFLPPGIPAS